MRAMGKTLRLYVVSGRVMCSDAVPVMCAAVAFALAHRRRLLTSVVVALTALALIAVIFAPSTGHEGTWKWKPQTIRPRAPINAVPTREDWNCHSQRLLLVTCERFDTSPRANSLETAADALLGLLDAHRSAVCSERTLMIDDSRCEKDTTSLCCQLSAAVMLPTINRCNISRSTMFAKSVPYRRYEHCANSRRCSSSMPTAFAALTTIINRTALPPFRLERTTTDEAKCGAPRSVSDIDAVIVPSTAAIDNVVRRVRSQQLALPRRQLAIVAKAKDRNRIESRIGQCAVAALATDETSADALTLLSSVFALSQMRHVTLSHQSAVGRLVAVIRFGNAAAVETADELLWYLTCPPQIRREELPISRRPWMNQVSRLTTILPTMRHRRTPLFIIAGCNGCGQEKVAQFLQRTQLVSLHRPLSDHLTALFQVKMSLQEFAAAKLSFLRSLFAAAARSESAVAPMLLEYNNDVDETVAMSLMHIDVASLTRMIAEAQVNVDVRLIACIRSPLNAALHYVRAPNALSANTSRLVIKDDPAITFHARIIAEQLNALDGDVLAMSNDSFAVVRLRSALEQRYCRYDATRDIHRRTEQCHRSPPANDRIPTIDGICAVPVLLHRRE